MKMTVTSCLVEIPDLSVTMIEATCSPAEYSSETWIERVEVGSDMGSLRARLSRRIASLCSRRPNYQ